MTRLQKLIDDRFLKKNRLARHLGIPKATMQNWTKGTSKIPAEAAFKIADFFGVDPQQVVGEIEEKRSRSKAVV